MTAAAAPASTADGAPQRGLRRWLLHPWLTVRVQILLGVVFVASALVKIVDPPSFAHMIYNYRLVPGPLVNFMALVMPWVELLAGLGLVLGIWRRTSAILIGVLLVVFMVAISINLARVNPVNCGCFDLKSSNKTQEQLLDEMRVVVARDVGMLFLVAQILAATQAGDRSRAAELAIDRPAPAGSA